ncbi:MAG TPA: oxidoreductase, partial [Spirochaetia bacterium]|nr:oxidoreductase [Spirochaetia bacterium]
KLQQGQELAIRGPFGDFRLHESRRALLFVAGGSGLAPIRSMLLTMAEQAKAGLTSRPATLYFSGRTRKDLFLMEELSALEAQLPFRFVPLLSNPSPDERWDGERGGMPAVLNRRLDRMDNHEAYLCGSTGMIDACIKVLRGKGLPEELLFFDKFL